METATAPAFANANLGGGGGGGGISFSSGVAAAGAAAMHSPPKLMRHASRSARGSFLKRSEHALSRISSLTSKGGAQGKAAYVFSVQSSSSSSTTALSEAT
eukprot:UC1_evm1s1583